ncbi:MAG: aldehyde ferredoxin oxidoreductase family protein [Actinobacteria bacterium]|nr:aldehyde ferredoxin oxidoreductase family protein [Actinomycetota bacterium]
MLYGYNGRILKVDLTENKIDIDEMDDIFYRTYMGGRNIGAYYLLKETTPKIDAFDPDNIIIFAVSVITGFGIPAVPKFSVVTKSPLTGGYAEAEAGGFWAHEFKNSGFDAVVIKGKAKKPVYLAIRNGVAEIKPATKLWGKNTGETEALIKEELEDKLVRVASIGPAGENLVRFACVISDSRYANGRSGTGAVMGSKNLKAIAVRGTSKPKVFNSESLKEMNSKFFREWRGNDWLKTINEVGTPMVVSGLNDEGIFPTRNFNEGMLENSEKISGETLRDTMMVGKEGCRGCPVKCKPVIKVENIEAEYGSPEYETIGALGGYCCIDDLPVIAKGNELCNKFGMDTISTGGMIAFAMECYENNIISDKETGNLKIKFGNSIVLLKLIEMIAYRNGIGNILAEGPINAVKEFGKESEKFAMHVKGQLLPAHEPRGKGFGLGLSYAIAPQGADHCTMEHDNLFESETSFFKNLSTLGILKIVNRFDSGPEKIRLCVYLEIINSLHNVLGLCNFPNTILGVRNFNDLTRVIYSVTGWDVSGLELAKVADRGINLAKCFNIREGFLKENDDLPERMFKPLKKGASDGKFINKKDFKKGLDKYYDMKGWDIKTGIPEKSTLEDFQ